MEKTKRLCPACGAANPMQSTSCDACGADMVSHLPVPLGERLPVHWKQVGTSLAVGAGAVALRAGLHLARHLWERQMAKPVASRERTGLPDQGRKWLSRQRQVEQDPVQRPQVRVRGRRVWGMWHSDGTRQVEVEEFDWQASDPSASREEPAAGRRSLLRRLRRG